MSSSDNELDLAAVGGEWDAGLAERLGVQGAVGVREQALAMVESAGSPMGQAWASMDALFSRVELDPFIVTHLEGHVAALHEGIGWGRRESVGLILQLRADNGAVSMPRVLLHNVAPQGDAQFRVNGDELRGVLQAVRAMGLHLDEAVLWHSHHGPQREASRDDVDNFPAWLCKRALVYHVPTGTTLAYEGRSSIAPSSTPHRDKKGRHEPGTR
jgi:hypothetical protein